MSNNPPNKPIRNELDLEHKGLVQPKNFATHLPMIEQSDIKEIERNNQGNITGQLLPFPTRSDHQSHSSITSDHYSPSPTRYDHHSHSPTRYDHYSPSPTRYDHHSHSPTRYDHHRHSPTRYDHHRHSLTKYDHHSRSPTISDHSPTRSNQHRHSAIRSDHYIRSPTRSNHHSRSPTRSDQRRHSSTRSDHHRYSPTRYDQLRHSPTRYDQQRHSPTRYDHHSHSPTRYDQRRHSPTRSDHHNRFSTRSDYRSCSPTRSDHYSRSPTRSNHYSRLATRSDQHRHSSTRSDHYSHSPTRYDQRRHSSTRSDHHSHSPTRSDHYSHSPTRSDQRRHSSTRSDHHSHSPTRSDYYSHSPTRSGHHNRSSTRSNHHSRSPTRSDQRRHSSTRSDHYSHSSTRSDYRSCSPTRSDHYSRSPTRSNHHSCLVTRSDQRRHSSTRSDHYSHSPTRYDYRSRSPIRSDQRRHSSTRSDRSLDLHARKPTLCQLDTQLHSLIQWERFGIHLPGITETDLQKIQSNNPMNVVRQKLVLFGTWLRRYPSASWDDVILALEKVGEIYLAEQIKTKYTCEDRPAIGQEVYASLSSEDVVFRELSDLHNTFTKLARDFRNGINKLVEPPNVHVLQEIITFIKDLQLYEIEGLNKVKTINAFIDNIRDHYNFLNCGLLDLIVEEYLKYLLPRTKAYIERVKEFKRSTPIQSLKYKLQPFVNELNTSRKYVIVIVKLQQIWENIDMLHLEKLVISLFPGYNPKWFTVRPGSICCIFLVPKSKAKSYISSSSEKLQFMRLTGIFGLQIGTTHVIRDDENESFTFDSRMPMLSSGAGHKNVVPKLCLAVASVDSAVETASEARTYDMSSVLLPHPVLPHWIYATSNSPPPSSEEIAQMFSCESNIPGIVDCPLSAETDLDMCRENGSKALHNACYNVLRELLTLLQNLNVSPVIDTLQGDEDFVISTQNKSITQHLVTACRRGDSAVIKRNTISQKVALVVACAEGNSSSVKQQLTESGINPNTTLISDITPLMIASSCGHIELLEYLLQAEADVNSKDEDGYTPLAYAITGSKSLTVVQRLLESGANPNTLLGGISIIEKAKEENGTEEIVNLLLKYSALQLHKDYEQLPEKVKKSINDQIEEKKITILQVAEKIETHFPVTSLTKAQNIHELFNKLQPYYSFLSCDILVDITREFIGGEIENELEGYLVMMRKFQKSVKIKQLKEVMSLVPIQHDTSDTCDVNIKLNGEWEEGTLENLQQLLKHIFHNKQYLLNHMTVDERDSLCITFTIPTSQSDGIADEVKGSKQFIECVGVSRVSVGDVDVSIMEDSKFSFSSGLLRAAGNGINKAVQFLLEMGVNIDDVDSNGRTALMLASKAGHKEIVEILLSAGANGSHQDQGQTAVRTDTVSLPHTDIDQESTILMAAKKDQTAVVNHYNCNPNKQDNNGLTALCFASQGCHSEVVQILLSEGADPNIQEEDGWTALMIADQNGHSEVVQILLNGGADPNFQKEDGTTALIYASQNGHSEVVLILLKGGADPNIQMEDGWTALFSASQSGHSEVVQILLKGGADPNIQMEEGWIALMPASQNGHSKVVQILLKEGADPNIQLEDGWAALFSASQNGHSKVVEILLKEGADPNIQKKNGATALMCASHNGDSEVVQVLLKGGADPNIQEEHGQTALMSASADGLSEVVQVLLKGGANPNIQEEDGWTALMIAIQNGHSEVVEILLKAGAADPNIQQKVGATALMCASQNGHSEVVQILLKGGADPNIQEEDGQTALMIASRYGLSEVVKVLLTGGADTNIKTKRGNEALTFAAKNKHFQVIELLKTHRV